MENRAQLGVLETPHGGRILSENEETLQALKAAHDALDELASQPTLITPAQLDGICDTLATSLRRLGIMAPILGVVPLSLA